VGDLYPDAIVCNGAGNYTVWVHRFWRYRKYRTELAPTSGSMGYGIPAAMAAKLLHPDRHVFAFAGDGCFQMNGMEFATAVQFGLPIVVIVSTTACTARSACTRNDTIPAAYRGPAWSIQISRRLRARVAALA
jgi:acetolactate synthase-1/2/3 large subunit